MKICYFAKHTSIHTIKWCNWFSERGNEVHVVSLEADSPAAAHLSDRVKVHKVAKRSPSTGRLTSLDQAKAVKLAKSVVSTVCPDIVHAHYLVDYGLLAIASSKDRHFMSVWGTDIYDYPRKSKKTNLTTRFVLSKFDTILSTSATMAEETLRYTSKNVTVTPFGVDMSVFSPGRRVSNDVFTVAIVKTLKKKYGIETLLRAFALVSNRYGICDIKLRIAGRGELEKRLKELSEELDIADKIEWLGFVPQDEVANIYRQVDLVVIPSESESFGVSAVEAQACGTPVIVSDAPGLMEATSPGNSSEVFPRGDYCTLAELMVKLIGDDNKRSRMAAYGRQYVESRFEVNSCFEKVLGLYCSVVNGSAK